jgi:hypothetical protein
MVGRADEISNSQFVVPQDQIADSVIGSLDLGTEISVLLFQ